MRMPWRRPPYGRPMNRAIPSAVVALVAVGATATAAPAAHRTPQHKALLAHVNVAASEFKFVLSKKSAKRGIVVFRVTNVGAVPHNFQISGRKTKMLSH